MKLFDAGLIVGGVVILLALALGFGASYFTKQDDSPIEEMAEEVIESAIEDALNLDEGAMNGKVDLTPSSKEG